MEEIVVKWYSIVSVCIVLLSVIGSVYVLWKKECNDDDDDDDDDDVDVDFQELWTSCWRGLHPGFLLLLRLLSFFVLTFFLSWDLHQWGASIFIYYTEWTYALVMVYFAIGSVVSAHGCWLYHTHIITHSRNIDESPGKGDLEDNSANITRLIRKKDSDRRSVKFQRQYYQEQNFQKAGFWGYLMQISFQISAGAAILTDIIFWCIIVPFVSNAHLGLNLLMGCMHTVNIIFLLLDTSINRLPFPWFRLAYFVLWSALYVIFQWLIHLCGFTWWPYPFLELSTPSAPLWYLVLAAFHIACYGMYALIVKVKDLLFSKLFPHSYVRSY
ncbi:unnamed protein product [Amaranthus hypochondriacus]